MTDRTLTAEMIAGMKAIRRWCDLRGNVHDSADKVRAIRLVAADYLARAGVKDDWAPPRGRKAPDV